MGPEPKSPVTSGGFGFRASILQTSPNTKPKNPNFQGPLLRPRLKSSGLGLCCFGAGLQRLRVSVLSTSSIWASALFSFLIPALLLNRRTLNLLVLGFRSPCCRGALQSAVPISSGTAFGTLKAVNPHIMSTIRTLRENCCEIFRPL